MGAQLPARWPGGSERRGQCQIVPWIDWTALWPVSCGALLGARREYQFEQLCVKKAAELEPDLVHNANGLKSRA
jgi:hypothetical protein